MTTENRNRVIEQKSFVITLNIFQSRNGYGMKVMEAMLRTFISELNKRCKIWKAEITSLP